ncbi:MAG: MFS transporter [Deltaproteobacteria bacterium]|nr:MFS transporter [Deltaproteobacteria bacterium]
MSTQSTTSFKSRLPWVLFLTTLFLFNFLARILLAPLLPAIEEELKISHAAAASLFVYLSSGYFTALLGSSFLSARFSHRQVLAGSGIAAGLVLLLGAASPSLATLRLTALLLGLSSGPYLPSAIAILTTMIAEQHWGKALAIHELAPNLAFTMAPLIAALMLPHFSWRLVLGSPGIIAIVLGLLFLKLGSAGNFRGEAPKLKTFRNLLALPTLWIMVYLFALGIASTMGLFNMLPAYLVSYFGMPQETANTLISLSRGFTIITVFLGGWATDRIGAKRTLIVVLSITGVITFTLGMVPEEAQILARIMVFLQPLLAVAFFPAGFAMLSASVPTESRNLAVAMTVSLAFLIGGGIVPYVIGLCGDAGHFDHGFAVVGLLIASGAAITPLLTRRTQYLKSKH